MDALARDAQMRRDVLRRQECSRWLIPAMIVALIAAGAVLLPSLSALFWWGLAILVWAFVSKPLFRPPRVRDGRIELPLPRPFPTAWPLVTPLISAMIIGLNVAFVFPPQVEWLGSVLGAGMIGLALAIRVRGDDVRLTADPAGVSLPSAKGPLSWTEIERIGPRVMSTGNDASLTVVVGGSNHWITGEAGTAYSAHPMWVLIEWLEHYRDHPEDRAELATQAGVERLERIHAELYDPTVEPTWFPPPRPTDASPATQ